MADVLTVDGVLAKLAGVAGAVVSMKFLRGTLTERLTTATSGAIISYFCSPYLSLKTGLPEGFCGFLLGLFGMAVASRIWEWIQTTPIAETWGIFLGWLRRRAGLKETRK